MFRCTSLLQRTRTLTQRSVLARWASASPIAHPTTSKGDNPNEQPTNNPRYEMSGDTSKIPLHQGLPLSGEDLKLGSTAHTSTSTPGSEAAIPRSSPSERQPAGSEYQGSPHSREESGAPGPTTIGASTQGTLFSSGEVDSPASEAKGQTPSTGGVGTPTGTSATHWTLNNVRRDHDLVKQNLERLFNLDDEDEKQRLFNDTVKMLAQHDVAEEVVIYPASKRLGDESLYQLAIDQTISAERILYDMDQEYGLDISKPGFNERLAELKKALLEHIEMEEKQMFPHLEQHLDTSTLESLDTWFENVKILAPTRPHPEGPHSPAAKLATGPVVAFLDGLRDLRKKFS